LTTRVATWQKVAAGEWSGDRTGSAAPYSSACGLNQRDLGTAKVDGRRQCADDADCRTVGESSREHPESGSPVRVIFRGEDRPAVEREGVMGIFNWRQQSPFEPLAEHMKHVRACVDLVLPMFECVRAGEHDKLKQLTEEVFKAEHEADKVKAQIRRTIPKVFSLPVFRGDLLAFVHVQDELADTAEDLAVQLTIKRLELPEVLAEEVLAYVQQALKVCGKVYDAVDLLKELVEADFAGPRGEELMVLVREAEHEEWVADKLQYKLAQQLFALEDELKPTDIFLWSQIFQNLGALANHADKTAERLRRMLAR
jgi:predicted phosphate transport protein (TIGR00153 family)